MKNMISMFRNSNKKTKIIISISALCVLTLGVVASVSILNIVGEKNKIAVIKKTSTKDDEKEINSKQNDKSKEDDKKSVKKNEGLPKEEINTTDPIASDNSKVDIPKDNTSSGNSSSNGGNSGGNDIPIAPSPPPSPPKVCNAQGVFFDNLPCNTILTQYNMNGWGIGNSGKLFDTSQEAWDYGNAQIDKWYEDLTQEPPYNGFDGYTVQFNDGTQKWTVMFK